MLKIIDSDCSLSPFRSIVSHRYNYALQKEKELTNDTQTISDFANGHLYYGLHFADNQWIFREWAPNATAIYLIGDFNSWQKNEDYRLEPIGNGVWQGRFSQQMIEHKDLYKLIVEWNNDSGERIPSYAQRVIQDEQTKIFSAQVWQPLEKYRFKNRRFKPNKTPLLIYECHIGMSSEDDKIASFNEFRENTLPRIKKLGYNCLQIMAIQEHPYYGSYGYHVSSFFAASSRFGTPEELKMLIDEAHSLGIAVVMDLVHSHSVKNEIEGLAIFDGSESQYFHSEQRREHKTWDSLCFDYGKNQVLHFLLSNCKFWIEEYKFDGFRFDGVTSMMYLNHGIDMDFLGYDCYYNHNVDNDAICYLTLANKLIHQINPNAITIAEDMSGMPGLAAPFADGGIGFDYRTAMGIPDFWIKYIKEVPDEEWKVGHIYWELTNRRLGEKTISYAESHDQALVGDKTIIFRLIDSDMYWHMNKNMQNMRVSRGVALHKMIRLITSTTINGGFLNFMGNEFGHPEWIDFPREGNGWSYKYAKRQWSLADNQDLMYFYLNEFDKQMISLIKSEAKFNELDLQKIWDNEADQVLAYQRKNLIFVFNFNPDKSFYGYGILAKKGNYKVVLNTDSKRFGGFGQSDDSVVHVSEKSHLKNKDWLKLYIASRSAIVLKKL